MAQSLAELVVGLKHQLAVLDEGGRTLKPHANLLCTPDYTEQMF
jgi:hypothetical protein